MKHIQNQSTPPRGRIRVAALLLAALAGGAVMVVELDVARSLTSVLGGSISVRAIVVITTMLALIPVVVLRPGPGVTFPDYQRHTEKARALPGSGTGKRIGEFQKLLKQ